jgi:D-alanyl-D-alanine carboxypeptidase
MLKKIFIGFVLFTTFSFAEVFSQTINKQKLDSLFNILAEKNKAMGSVAISKNGLILYSRAIGYSVITGNEKKPATEITKYRIGSISKMFTATIIFQLIEEGRLTLTTTLSTYFPTLPNAGKITIGNLLNHRSGLHNFTDDADYTSWMLQAKTQKEMLAIIGKSKVDFEPNEKAAYSNSNFVVLGFIIEKICRKNYATILRQRITTKAALLNTYYGGNANTNKNESLSYRFLNDWVQQPETNMSIPRGAGAIVSTPTDLTKFIEALFSLKFITANSLAQMKTVTDGYGMGMFQLPFYNKKVFGHNGGIDGFLSNLAYFPEDSLAVAYCTNGEVYPFNDILIGVLSSCFNKDDYLIPTFKTVILNKEDADKYTGVYSSTQLPLKITITWDNTTLFAQATGQSAFPLEAIEKNKFKFDQAGVKIDFDTDKNEFILKQGGVSYLFTKNK